jgi:choline dehydrogenase-like flavoprotein
LFLLIFSSTCDRRSPLHSRIEHPLTVNPNISSSIVVLESTSFLGFNKPSNGQLSAQGVQVVTKDGADKDIIETEEVALSDETYSTPQLPELSGIRHAALLKSHGIEVLIDNPHVGGNATNHGSVSFSGEIADDQVSDVTQNPEVAGAAVAKRKAGGVILISQSATSRRRSTLWWRLSFLSTCGGYLFNAAGEARRGGECETAGTTSLT